MFSRAREVVLIVDIYDPQLVLVESLLFLTDPNKVPQRSACYKDTDCKGIKSPIRTFTCIFSKDTSV